VVCGVCCGVKMSCVRNLIKIGDILPVQDRRERESDRPPPSTHNIRIVTPVRYSAYEHNIM
jgi:hypothetical protein